MNQEVMAKSKNVLQLGVFHITMPPIKFSFVSHTLIIAAVARDQIHNIKFEPRHVFSNNVAFWQVYAQTSLCSLILSLEMPNDDQSVALQS